ncbi:T9SS type A sorting domain-containing protein [bacterium]|nr:T9SS type A sorting domain-containing protein [bacterium]
MKHVIITLFLATIVFGQVIDDFPWSDPIYIIDGDHTEDDPVAKYIPNDEMFVVWFSGWPLIYNDISYAQVTEEGELTIPPTRIFEEDGINDRMPTVAVDSQGHAHIFWRRNTSGLFDIWYTQIDTDDGAYLVDPKLLIPVPTNGNNLFMYAVPDDEDNIHLLYCIREWDGIEWWESPQHAKIAPDGTLLGFNHRIAEDSGYEMKVTWGEGIAVDSDGNVHATYTFDRSRLNGSSDFSVVYRKLDGDDGTPLSSMRDLGYPGKLGGLAHLPYDFMPAVCMDSQDHVHIAWVHAEDYVAYVVYIILDKDGDTVRDRRIVFSDEDVGFGQKNFFVSNNGRIILFANYEYGIGVLEFNEEGDLLRDPVLLIDVLAGHSLQGPFGCVGTSGHYRVVGYDNRDSSIKYVYQTEDWAVDDPVLSADSVSDGILLSWQEEGGLIGSTWRLERNGDHLVNLSGNALYRYLDRDAIAGVTNFYTLEATLPDGSVRRFGPIEAAWPGPDTDRLTLYAPYPCPATDQVTLSYSLPEDAQNVELSLYDLSGRLVASSISLSTAPGRHEVAYDTSALTPGVYIARLITNTASTTQRLVIAR